MRILASVVMLVAMVLVGIPFPTSTLMSASELQAVKGSVCQHKICQAFQCVRVCPMGSSYNDCAVNPLYPNATCTHIELWLCQSQAAGCPPQDCYSK